MVEGVIVSTLKQFPDDRGKVMHMLRSTDPHFKEFGEIYFSIIYPGAIKAWHLHKKKTGNLAVPVGMIKLVLYDPRPESPTHGEIQEIFLGPDNYRLVTIPPLIWYGFRGTGSETALVANCATRPHDAAESESKDPHSPDIPYQW